MANVADQNKGALNRMAEFFTQAILATRQRKTALGLAPDTLLDPEAPIDQQVAMLRGLFLDAEKAAQPFAGESSSFWRVMRARLQPVVLAYLTHERFMRTLDQTAQALRPDALDTVYQNQLEHSERFRAFFAEISARLEKGLATDAESQGDSTHSRLSRYKTADDSAAIQNNVLKMLEKQLKELEAEYVQQQDQFTKTKQELLILKDVLHEKNDDIQQLKLQLAKREDEASQRSQQSSDAAFVLTVPNDNEELTLKIATLEKELASTSEAAYNAYMASSDLGVANLFLVNSYKCKSLDQLTQELLRTLVTFGLKILLAVQKDKDFQYVATAGTDLHLKTEFERNRGKGELVEGQYLIFYQQGSALLVQNPPWDQPDRYGRISETFAMLLQGFEHSRLALESSHRQQRQVHQLEQVLVRCYDIMQETAKADVKQLDKLARLINLFGQDLRKSLEITPGDEKSIRLSMDLKKLEDKLRDFLSPRGDTDSVFLKGITKIVEGIQARLKQQAP